MSVRFNNQTQQVVNIEDEDNQHLQSPHRVPLDRMTSREERTERQRVRRIFDKYDVNRDGYLQKREIRRMIKENPGQCNDLPKGLAKVMLHMHDGDGDGRLDFEEFFKLSQEHNWLFHDICVKYCRYVVPRRNGAVADETASVSAYSVATYDTIDGAYESQMKFIPPPLTMAIFSIIEVAIFVYDIVSTQDYRGVEHIGTRTDGPAATLFIYNPYRREEAWRFVTYMFVHVGVMHLLMNLLVQLFLGTALELVHCWWRVALIYLSGVVAGSMGTSIASPRIFLAGASGGVYALITAHIATIILNWHEMEYALIQLFVFLVFCGTDLGFSIYRHISDANDRVGYVAHLSGAIAGLLVGIGVLRNLNVRPYEKKLWWIAVTIYSALMVTGICFHIFYPDYFPVQLHVLAPSKSGFP